MKKTPAIAGWAICTAILMALLSSTLVFAEGESPTPAAEEPAAVVETATVEATAEEGSDLPEATPSAEPGTEPTGSGDAAAADGAEPTQEASATPTPENTPTTEPETAPTDEADAEPVAEATQEPTATETPAAETPTAETPDEDSPDVVLSDADGEAIDPASADGAEKIASGDPWWMVGTTKYMVVLDAGDCPIGTLDVTCWADPHPIEHALSLIDSNGWVPSDGKLYVEAGDYSDTVVIDGSSGNGNLSGLKGLVGSGSSLINLTGSISISNTISGFTLSGFTVLGSVSLDSNSGSLYLDDLYIQNDSGDGLTVTNHNGNVSVTNVQSRDNHGDGAHIDNTAASRSSVTITNSSFDYNDDENDLTWNVGLYINTNGPVTLDGVATSRNNGNGTEIHGFSALTISNGLFDHNYTDPYSADHGYGLLASTNNAAAVKIENVFAYYNDNTAINLETAGSVLLNYVRASHSSIRTGAISDGETVNERLNEDNKYSGDRWYFSGTTGQELEILLESDFFDAYLELYDAATDTLLTSNDDLDGTTTNAQINYTLSADGQYYILVKTLESSGSPDGDYSLSLNDSAHENETDFDIPGMRIDTTGGYGTVTINNGMFQDNSGDGLQLDGNKTATLKTVDASYNSGNGAVLDTCQYDELLGRCLGSGAITLDSPSSGGWYNANYFLGNSGTGLLIRAGSTIKLTNTSAYDNLGNGLEIDNAGSRIDIIMRTNLTNFSNVFRSNGVDGVKITTDGKIMIYDTQADSNGMSGFHLSSGSVIYLYNVNASSNGYDGILIDNSTSSSTIAIRNNVRDTQGQYSSNGSSGIEITSLGSILIYNVVASENGASGILLDTCVADGGVCTGLGSITLNTYFSYQNTLDSNNDYGLYVTSSGSVNLNYLSASKNGDSGIFIDNTISNGTINIKNAIRDGSGTYSYNGGDGITIDTLGTINMYNVDLSSNAGNGLTIDNCQFSGGECVGLGRVLIKGLYNQGNTFSNNHDYGLYILSGGSVYLMNINADRNGYNGLYVNNQLELAIQPVTLNASRGVTNTFNYNGALTPGTYPGVEIHTYGNIYLRSLESNNNYAAGAYLYNKDATISEPYIRIHDGTFDENQGSGLLAYTKGNILFYGVTASYNSLINSDIVLEGETVYERLTSISSYDTWWFEITESTAITDFTIILESLEFDGYLELYDADGNLLASDDNSFSDYDAEISISLTELGKYYIRVMAADANHGNYTLSINDEAHNYGTDFLFYGALIDASAGDGVVFINKGSTNLYNDFNDNNYTGIEVKSNNTINAYNLSASDNGDTGAYLNNSTGRGNITMKMLGRGESSLFNSNSEIGLFAASLGTINITNPSASTNGSGGAVINNCIPSEGICQGSGNVYIRSSATVNEFDSNQAYGLYVSSGGHIFLYDVQADANGFGGLYVKNQYTLAYGNVTVRSSRNNLPSFSGNGWKNPQGTYSIEIYSNGVVSLYAGNVIANYGGGALIDNDATELARNVYLNDTNFEANQGNGLWVNSNGNIYLTGVQSRYNSVNSGQIDLLGETIFEHLTPYYESDTWWFDGYTDNAVDIILESDEFDVFLQVFDQDGNLIAVDDDGNGGTDARLTFTLPANGNYYIRVSGNNGGNGNYTLSLNDAAMEYPTLYRYSGAHLDNHGGSGSILITTSNFNSEPNFYHNNYDGLEILTAGSVTLLNLSAMQNGEDGVNINNIAGSGSVLVRSTSKRTTSSFSYNTKFGLYIEASGNVSVLNNGRMFLRDNGYSGAYIDNTAGDGAYVTIYSAEVNQNVLKGLEIHSAGNVITNNLLAVNNGSNGVFIDNSYGSGYINVQGSKGENNISDNGASGLAVYSNGSISVDNVIAIQNGGNGMIINNATGSGNISVTRIISRLNARDGLQIISGGPTVTLKYVQSMSNGEGYDGDGLYIEIPDPSYLKIYYSTFIGNEGNGIDVLGSVPEMPLLYSVSYFGNDTDMDGDRNMQVTY
ncbi:MAG: hypothetical protein PWQ55_1059 [Chloroflexota bacterium]|nr:hypothetical protein [Chloroflexota bacterium]